MMDTELKALRCGTDSHVAMTRLLEDHRPMQSGTFSLWVCRDCGVMALHLETAGTIYWYERTTATKTQDRGGVRPRCRCGNAEEHVHGADGHMVRESETHMAGCAYCPTKFACACGAPGPRHMCPRCDSIAEDSKMGGGTFPFTGDPNIGRP